MADSSQRGPDDHDEVPADGSATEHLPRVIADPSRGLSRRATADAGPPPRLSTVHLLLWMGCTAANLALVRALAEQKPGAIGAVIVCFESTLAGGAWAGLLIFISRRWRRTPWAIEPGHWLVAILGIVVLAEPLLHAAAGKWIRRPHAVLAALHCGLLVVPTFSRHLAARWKVVFFSTVLVRAIPLLSFCFHVWFSWHLSWLDWGTKTLGNSGTSLLSIVFVAIGVACDVRSRQKHTWLHWMGLSLWCLVIVQNAIAAWLG